MKSKFQKEEVMKVIRKRQNVCSFEDLDFGDIFKLSETGSLFMKIDNLYLDIEEGRLYGLNSSDEVIPVDGCFVEWMVEHDA